VLRRQRFHSSKLPEKSTGASESFHISLKKLQSTLYTKRSDGSRQVSSAGLKLLGKGKLRVLFGAKFRSHQRGSLKFNIFSFPL
jgi:hypothetical protein